MLQTHPQRFLSVQGVQAKSAGDEFDNIINCGQSDYLKKKDSRLK